MNRTYYTQLMPSELQMELLLFIGINTAVIKIICVPSTNKSSIM